MSRSAGTKLRPVTFTTRFDQNPALTDPCQGQPMEKTCLTCFGLSMA